MFRGKVQIIARVEFRVRFLVTLRVCSHFRVKIQVIKFDR